ncbi:hypothetical protein OBV_25000 [Oscillibacter valericigenes Sjm18-20]|nr:hypothetical protein OBV_25000 [Oscillibacter valericigenes Sjm18-20]
MASFPTMTVTNAGQAALTKGLNGQELSFPKIVLGDGELNGQSISTLTAMIRQKAYCDVTRKAVTGGAYQVGGLLLPANITSGFYWREIGLIVTDPDTGAEVLYAYANAGTATDYIDPNATDSRFEKNIYVNTKISSASSVTISIPSSDTYALADMSNINLELALKVFAAAVHAANHATGGSDPLTPAQIGAAATETLTATISTGWSSSGGYYYKQVSVPGMLATDNPIADILPGSDNAANKLYAEAWGKVLRIDTLDGAVKLWCTAAPTTAFPAQFKVVR